MYGQIKTLKGQVKYCLEQYEATRDNDITLMLYVWLEFYKHMVEMQDGKPLVSFKNLYELPREDNIKRVRAYWQNVKKICLPTKEEVAKKRGLNINEWRVSLGYPTKESAGTNSPSWKI